MNKKSKLFAAAVIFAGIFLRFYRLGSRSFWCDEFLAISLARLNPAGMLGWIIKNDAHPPLFYAVVHLVFNFSRSEFGMRFIPALSGAGAILVFYLLLRENRPENPIPPLLLFALSPAAVLWSQMVKSYSMLTFFSLLSVLMFFKYGRNRRFIYGVGWVLSALISLYLHNYGVIVFIAQVVTVFLLRKKLPPKVFLPPVLVILAGYLPYLAGPVFSQVVFVKGATHTVTNPFLRIAYTFFYFIFGETVNPFNLKFVLPGTVLFLTFFLAGFFQRKDSLIIFSTAAFITAVAAILFVKATIPQNLIHLQPFFFVLVSSGFDKIKVKKGGKIILPVLAALCLIPPLYYYYRGDSLQYHDVGKLVPYRQISRLIEDEGKGGEAVIFTEARERRFSGFFPPYGPWDWYYRGGLPLIEFTPVSVSNVDVELDKIYKGYEGFWLLLNYGFAEHAWNDRVKDFFLDGKSVKIMEMKLVKNYSFLDLLKGKGKHEYYFLEVYHLKRAENE